MDKKSMSRLRLSDLYFGHWMGTSEQIAKEVVRRQEKLINKHL